MSTATSASSASSRATSIGSDDHREPAAAGAWDAAAGMMRYSAGVSERRLSSGGRKRSSETSLVLMAALSFGRCPPSASVPEPCSVTGPTCPVMESALICCAVPSSWNDTSTGPSLPAAGEYSSAAKRTTCTSSGA